MSVNVHVVNVNVNIYTGERMRKTGGTLGGGTRLTTQPHPAKKADFYMRPLPPCSHNGLI